ncbi:MAG TPA: hypothetical protein VH916_08530 [Dehalococcoidia bacterium]|jgi:hypothetical protein
MVDELNLAEQREAELLDRYWLALAGNLGAAPPPGLDPALVDVAWCLAAHLDAPEPEPVRAAELRLELEAEAAQLRLRLEGQHR